MQVETFVAKHDRTLLTNNPTPENHLNVAPALKKSQFELRASFDRQTNTQTYIEGEFVCPSLLDQTRLAVAAKMYLSLHRTLVSCLLGSKMFNTRCLISHVRRCLSGLNDFASVRFQSKFLSI